MALQTLVTDEELAALAAVIEADQLPKLQAIDLATIADDTLDNSRFLNAMLSLPSIKVIHLPYDCMKLVDLRAFADALENRSKRGQPGLKELPGTTIRNFFGRGDKSFDAVARIWKAFFII